MKKLKSFVRKGQAVPRFFGETQRGTNVSTDEFDRKNELVLFFFDPELKKHRDYLNTLKAAQAQLMAMGARIVAVSAKEKGVPREAAEVTVISDANNEIRGKFVFGGGGAVFIIDKFQSLYKAYLEGEPDGFPSARELISSIEFLQKQCPECGAPVWPEE